MFVWLYGFMVVWLIDTGCGIRGMVTLAIRVGPDGYRDWAFIAELLCF
jgi:hypothetical protein